MITHTSKLDGKVVGSRKVGGGVLHMAVLSCSPVKGCLPVRKCDFHYELAAVVGINSTETCCDRIAFDMSEFFVWVH